jgi:hypothetical protein
MTRSQAQKLAHQIKTYWSRLGHDVEVWMELEPYVPIADGGASVGAAGRYTIRSNLVRGLPRDVRKETIQHIARSMNT